MLHDKIMSTIEVTTLKRLNIDNEEMYNLTTNNKITNHVRIR